MAIVLVQSRSQQLTLAQAAGQMACEDFVTQGSGYSPTANAIGQAIDRSQQAAEAMRFARENLREKLEATKTDRGIKGGRRFNLVRYE